MTMEAVAAAELLRNRLPDLTVRVVNVVDLMRLQDPSHHPHGLGSTEFDAIFTRDQLRGLKAQAQARGDGDRDAPCRGGGEWLIFT